jgi:hypothetical protein
MFCWTAPHASACKNTARRYHCSAAAAPSRYPLARNHVAHMQRCRHRHNPPHPSPFSPVQTRILMFMGCSTFSEHRINMSCRYTVIPECAVAKISRDAPLEKVIGISGCGSCHVTFAAGLPPRLRCDHRLRCCAQHDEGYCDERTSTSTPPLHLHLHLHLHCHRHHHMQQHHITTHCSNHRRRSLQVESGSSAAVFGLGGVGLSVVMGLKVLLQTPNLHVAALTLFEGSWLQEDHRRRYQCSQRVPRQGDGSDRFCKPEGHQGRCGGVMVMVMVVAMVMPCSW